MTADATDMPRSSSTAGIAFILLGMAAISVNDMLIKRLSGDHPLHQIVFIRSAVGLCFTMLLIRLEGGFGILRTRTPFLHALRGLLIVTSNLAFFAALAAIPLAEATALFFVAPLMITLLAIPMLGESVGPWRLGAVGAGFTGVVVALRPWESAGERDAPLVVMLLPVAAALTYALNQVLTRRLGVASKASAMAAYIQITFVVVSALFYLVAGDGRFAEGIENESLQFLLRAWTWPSGSDAWLLAGLGFNAAIIGYALSQAYRLSDAATVAPFEYAGMPLAVFWGWLIWNELPGASVAAGTVLIVGSGLFVFLRERIRGKPLVGSRRVHRRY